MTTFLERAKKEGNKVYHESATRLLDLAATNNASFRAVVTGMVPEQKQFLEQVLKSRAGVQQSRDNLDNEREPTIALKMNFGG